MTDGRSGNFHEDVTSHPRGFSVAWSSSVLAAGLFFACFTCSAAPADCDLPARFTLRSGQGVLYETWDRIPHEFGPGETVTLDWADGVFTVNGFVHLPHEAPPPWKVEVLRRLYGRVPFVQNYVATATGDSVARWNEASQALERLQHDMYAGARRIYQAAKESLGSPERAIYVAAAWLEQSEHVDSTTVGTPRWPGSMLKVFWKGEGFLGGVMVDLVERDPIRGRTYRDPCPKQDVCSVAKFMRYALARPGNYRVEFVRGNINMFGSAGIQYSTGGSRSTDPRYHDNPYVDVSRAGSSRDDSTPR